MDALLTSPSEPATPPHLERYIPHAFGRSKAPLLTLADVEAKKVMLNVIGDVGAAVASEKASKASKKKSVPGSKTEPAPIDVKCASTTHQPLSALRMPTWPPFFFLNHRLRASPPFCPRYASLGATLVPVDKASATFKMIHAYTSQTQGSRRCTVEEVFEVTRVGDTYAAANKAAKNRKLLWHGEKQRKRGLHWRCLRWRFSASASRGVCGAGREFCGCCNPFRVFRLLCFMTITVCPMFSSF